MKTMVVFQDAKKHWKERRQQWIRNGFTSLSDAKPSADRYLILIHASDLVSHLQKNPGIVTAAEDYLLKKWGGDSAILYFSGAGRPFNLLAPYGATRQSLRAHYYEADIERTEDHFARRINLMVQQWVGRFPDWSMLRSTWLIEAREFAVALRFLTGRTNKPDIVKLTGEGAHPFSTQRKDEASAEVGLHDIVESAAEIRHAIARLEDAAKVSHLCRRFLELTNGLALQPVSPCERFFSDRSRVSHGLVGNILNAGLQPCGSGEGRFGSQDIVFGALCGQPKDYRHLADVLARWRQEVAPAITALISDVQGRYGFEATSAWHAESARLRVACEYLTEFSVDTQYDADTSRALAAEFWTACDTVVLGIKEMKTSFGRFFQSWQPKIPHG